MSNRIRIELNSPAATDAKVFYLVPGGPEIDISSCITGFTVNAKVGEATTATLHTILVEGRMNAEVEDVLVTKLKPRSRWRRRLGRRLSEVTHIGSRSRVYVSR